MKKRLAGILLAVIMTLTMVPSAAFAAGTGQQTGTLTQQEQMQAKAAAADEAGEADQSQEESDSSVSMTPSEEDEDLGAADEEIPDDQKIVWEDEEDLNSADDVVMPEGNSSGETSTDEDLGAGDEISESSSENSVESNAEEADGDDPDLGAADGEADKIEGWVSSDETTPGGDEDLGAADPSISASPATTYLAAGESKYIDVTYMNCSTSIYYAYGMTNTSTVNASWTGWSGNTNRLKVTGKNSGSVNIHIYLKRASDGKTLGHLYVTVYVNVPVVKPSVELLSVVKGSAKKVTFTVHNYSGNCYMQYSANSSMVGCSWGSWSGSSIPLTITGKKTGTTYVTVKLFKGGTSTLLASTKVEVMIKATPKLSLSASSVSLTAGNSSVVRATYSNYDSSVYMAYGLTNTSAVNCSWGNWSGSTVPLTVTGKSKGTCWVYIYLKDASTNQTLATAYFKVSVTQNAKVTASPGSLGLKTGESSKINVSTSGTSGTITLAFGLSNNRAVSCSWGSWSGNSISLTVTGKNAGSATITIYLKNESGQTLATTSILVTVNAFSSGAKVTLSQSSMSLKAGNAGVVNATVTGASDTIYLSYSSTNTYAYQCSWASNWSGNSISLTVTGKNAGSGTVTVYLKRSSDNATLSSAKLTVTVSKSTGVLSQLSYSFGNFSGEASLALCQYMYKNRAATAVYNAKIGAGGNCYGMASTAGMLYNPSNGILPSGFRSSATMNSELELSDQNNSWGLNLREYVQAMQVAQSATIATQTTVSGSGLSSLVSNVTRGVNNKQPLMLTIFGIYDNAKCGHAILAYGVQSYSSTQDRLLIYDNNYPLSTRYMTLYKNSSTGKYTGWSYPLTGNVTWGSGYSYGSIGYVTYSTYMNLWSNRGSLTLPGYNLLCVNKQDFTVKDVEDNVVATVKDGTLETDNDKIRQVNYTSLDINNKENTVNKHCLLYVPVDLYTVENDETGNEDEQFTVEIANEELSARVETEGNVVTVCADDSCNLSSVVMDAEKDEAYQITLGSTREGEPSEVEYEGVGEGETISVMMEDGNLETCNMENISASVDEINNGEKKSTYTIRTSSDGGGSITPEGETRILSGKDITCVITPDDGYEIKDVKVDGKSVGSVKEYTFKEINADHDISVMFTKKEKPAAKTKVKNTVQVSDIVKTASVKVQKFNLSVSVKDDAKITYKSNNPAVRINSSGKVTISKNFVGEAKISIAAEETGNYLRTVKTIVIKVNPAGTKLVKVKKAAAGKLKVTWKANKKVTGYQIQYGRKKSFKNAKVLTVKKYKTVSKTISKLKKGKKYYVRIRTYKTVNKKKYYSSWSKVKTGTVKK